MPAAGDRMPHWMPPAMVPRHLARLQRLQLLWRSQRIQLLFRLAMNLLDLLLPLLRCEGSLGANRFHFRPRSPLDRLPFLHR
jgi:hypothetical protein